MKSSFREDWEQGGGSVREQNRQLQRRAVFMEVGLSFLGPICSLSMGEVRKWEDSIPRNLTVEESNCFKMVSPALDMPLIKVLCVCLGNNQTK